MASENVLIGLKNRLLQVLALYAPGATGLRVWLHRGRGVRIGHETFIGTAAILETSYPWLISIGDRVNVGVRTVIIAHFRHSREQIYGNPKPSVVIEDDVYVGPGAIILANVTIGHGAVICAGTVVTRNVPAGIMVRGNPAEPIAECGIPMLSGTDPKEFYWKLKPIRRR